MTQTKLSTQAMGRVTAAHGRHYIVEFDDNTKRTCFPKGKKAQAAAVGDYVIVNLSGINEGAIEKIINRKNLLYRSDHQRSKQFAANVDQVLIVVATQPYFSNDLLGRAVVAAYSEDIKPIVILNKIDIVDALDQAIQKLKWLDEINVAVIKTNAMDASSTQAQLMPILSNKTSLLLGQSAMGKSSLLNALVPHANAHTQEHSQALGAGKHTTTSTQLYQLSNGGALIDSPGFQAFGLQHLTLEQIANGFHEFKNAHCRFYNCSHRHEPGCAVLEKLKQNEITNERYQLYVSLITNYEAGLY